MSPAAAVRALAPAKVNLCLLLGPLRPDGKHDLVTLFESVSLADELTMRSAEGADRVVCPGVAGPNLIDGALAALRERGWGEPAVAIDVRKRIPVAGGMGGGSADAAAMLRLAAAVAPGRPEELAEIAASLGSDVPSQLVGGVMLGTGTGDVVESLEPLGPHAFLVLPQPFPLPTADVYREADRLGLPRPGEELEAHHRELWAAVRPGARLADDLLVNDLEPAALSLRPEIAAALDAARAHGADRALVSGSGPTVIGVFWGEEAEARAQAAAEALSRSFPAAAMARPVGPEFGLPRIA